LQTQILSQQVVPLQVLREWSATRTVEGAQRGHELLTWLEESTTISVSPQHYVVVLDAYSAAGDLKGARSMFEKLVQQKAATPVTLNVLLHAYARQKDATAALDLLQQSCPTIPWRTTNVNVVLRLVAPLGWAESAQALVTQLEGTLEDIPLTTYHYLLQAYQSQLSTAAGPAKVRIVSQMQKVLHNIQNSPHLQPTLETFLPVLQAVVSVATAAPEALRWAETTQTLWDSTLAVAGNHNQSLPTSLVLQVMNVYATTETDRFARLAEQLWMQQQQSTVDHPSETTTVAYNTLLKAWKHDLVQSERIFNHMMMDTDTVVVVNDRSYTTYLSTLAHAIGRKQAKPKQQVALAQKAQALLDQIKASHSNTTAIANAWTYNTVLHAWCNCQNLDRAQALLDEMESGAGPAPTTSSYTTL